jgi:hypothetical protein
MCSSRFVVIAGLDPAIHVFLYGEHSKTWMPGSRPVMTKSDMKAAS